jgi:hypothetical protein
MHANGASQEDRMRITGHSSTRVNDGYTHADERTIRETTSTPPDSGEGVRRWEHPTAFASCQEAEAGGLNGVQIVRVASRSLSRG